MIKAYFSMNYWNRASAVFLFVSVFLLGCITGVYAERRLEPAKLGRLAYRLAQAMSKQAEYERHPSNQH